MQNKTRKIVQAALIAAMYAALCHLQNALFPTSASWAIQFRVAEALCVLSFFTPAATPGLTIGCFIFNLTYLHKLPLDPLFGPLATCMCCLCMRWMRKTPILALCMPALFNALLVGLELSISFHTPFWLNALYVAIGELAVLYSLGIALYLAVKPLAHRIFR